MTPHIVPLPQGVYGVSYIPPEDRCRDIKMLICALDPLIGVSWSFCLQKSPEHRGTHSQPLPLYLNLEASGVLVWQSLRM